MTPPAIVAVDEETDTDAKAKTSIEAECPECDGSLADTDAETVCQQCGLVVDADAIDHGAEWRAFTESERLDRCRTGAPRTPRRHDRGLGAKMSDSNRDINGQLADGAKRARLERMRIWDYRTNYSSKHERNRSAGLADVRRVCSAFEFGDDRVDRACQLFQEGHAAGLAYGRSIEQVVGAAVLATARETGYPLTAGMLLERIEVASTGRLFATYQLLVDETSAEPRLVEPVDYLGRLVSELDIDESDRRTIRELLLEVQSEGIHVGRKPAGVAGAAVYLVEGETTQDEIADAADVTATTIRNTTTDIQEAEIHD